MFKKLHIFLYNLFKKQQHQLPDELKGEIPQQPITTHVVVAERPRYLPIRNADDLQEGMVLIDKEGNRRRIIMKQSDGKYWLSHKNSEMLGQEKTLDQLKSNRIIPDELAPTILKGQYNKQRVHH